MGGGSDPIDLDGIWAIARHDLRLSDAEFWGLTIYEFNLLVDRWHADVKFRAKCAGAEVKDEPKYLSGEALGTQLRAMVEAHNAKCDSK